MSLEDLMKTDAKNIVDVDGVEVLYTKHNGDSVSIKVIPQVGGLMPQQSNLSTNEYKLVIAVAKLDIPDPVRNGDTVRVPAHWVEEDSDPVRRVGAIVDDRTDPGVWLMGLK